MGWSGSVGCFYSLLFIRGCQRERLAHSGMHIHHKSKKFENVFSTISLQDVQPNSPAHLACLQAHSDYIIGADSVLHESEDLFTLVEAHEGRQLKLYVYNTESDSCREVTITPNSQWGGEGR